MTCVPRVHGILHDTWQEGVCLYLESDTLKLHSVTWGGRYVRPIELLSSGLIWHKPAKGNAAACLYNRCWTKMMKGRRSANRGSQSKCSLHSDSWGFIISLIICIIYIEIVLSCHIHLLWTWVITLWVMSNYTLMMVRNDLILEICSTFTHMHFYSILIFLRFLSFLTDCILFRSCGFMWATLPLLNIIHSNGQWYAKSYAIRWRWRDLIKN